MKNKTVNAASVSHFIGDMTDEQGTFEPSFVKDATSGAMFLVRDMEIAPNGAIVFVIEPERVT